MPANTPSTAPDPRALPRADLPPVPLARPGRRVAAVLVLLLVAWMVAVVFTNPNFQWKVVGKYLFGKEILDGVKLTIELTVSAMAIGVTLASPRR